MVLHLPIGLIAGLMVLEALALVRRKPAPREITATLLWLTAGSAVLAAVSGFVLSYEGDFSGPTLDNHLRLGIAFAIAAVACAVVHARARTAAPYRATLLATVALLIPAGHLGASMTHGEGFLTEPFRPARTVAPSTPAEPVEGWGPGRFEGEAPSFAAILPIFESRCVSCHGGARPKGGLRLDDPDGLRAGARRGPVLVAGRPDESELVRRLRLPLDADGHMPPANKPQLEEAEIGAIEAWIAAGAPFDHAWAGAAAPAPLVPEAVTAEAPEVGAEEPSIPTESDDDDLAAAGPPPPPAAMDELTRRLVHVERESAGSNLVRIDFAAIAAGLSDGDAVELLTPLAQHVTDLSLARAPVGDAVLAVVAKMPELRRLDLRATNVTDAGLGALKDHARLEELVLSQTAAGDAALDALAAMPALRRLYVWRSAMTDEGLQRLHRERPQVLIVAGDEPESAALEVEGELSLTGDAPLPGQPAGAPALTPGNTKCPVSGAAVDPRYSIVFNGRVIGFCCPNCPKEFWSDPQKFEPRLE